MKPLPSPADDEVLGDLIDWIAGQIQAGNPVDPERLLQDHPARAEELRELLPAIQVMAEMGQALNGNKSLSSNPLRKTQELGTLGDFRILREVGRGGMGVVYEAEQLSLSRRVALKVLPFAATMDPRNLERFRNEAQAAAHLHHNHIVPVFGVGCERGVPYYVMQFIEGQTLAEVISDLGRQSPPQDAAPPEGQEKLRETRRSAISTLDHPTRTREYFRKVAHLGIQAAEALDYAHQRGIIHRDIKPANLILDSTGNLWITDFGLANVQGNDARLTRTGDFLGTIRYMSPEQASPKRYAMDPRSDVYSLGVTLYELLTLEPAFAAQDRAEMLVQLAYQEPRPPRSVNPAVPPELETIVLKAMAKNQEERYATAQELTDDLRRFLDDQPIKARRPTLAQRWLKWTRRHRAVVRTVLAAAVVIVAALIFALFMVWNEKDKTLAAYQEKDKAFQAEKQQRRNSEENVRLAMQTLDQIYLGVVERWSPRDASPQSQDREILEKALLFYELFAQKNADNVEARKETARAYLRAADVCALLGQDAKAEDAYRKALDRFQKLADEFPAESTYRQDLGRCCAGLGMVLATSRRLDQAVAQYRQAISHCQKLTAAFPGNAEYQRELAEAHHLLASAFSAGDHNKEAEAAFAKAVSLQKRLRADKPKDPKNQLALASLQRDLAFMLWRCGRLAEAERHLQEGQSLLEPETTGGKGPAERADRKYQARMAALQDSFGTLFHEVAMPEKAEAALTRAIKSWKELAAEYPNVPGYQLEMAASQFHLGNLFRDLQRPKDAGAMFRRALAILEPMNDKSPGQPKVQDVLADTLNNLGMLLAEANQPKEAEKLFRRSLALHQDLVHDCPNVSEYRRRLGCVHHHLGILLRNTRRPDEAEKSYRRAIAVLSKLSDVFPRVDAYRYRLAMVYGDLGCLLKINRNFPESEKALQAALEHLKHLLAGNPRLSSMRKTKGQVLRDLADVLAATARFVPAEKVFRQSLVLTPDDPFTLNNLAWLLVTCPDTQLRNAPEALELVQKALTVGPNAGCAWSPKNCCNTLGVAYYRAGNWQKAKEALDLSMKLNSGGDAADWFFLAMTCRKLGDENNAKMWYQRAVEQMKSIRPANEELQRFQKEAAQVLAR